MVSAVNQELFQKNLLHLQDVYKSYGSKVILDNIDLSVAKGELCTVVGPSGCGKSTLLRIIVGQERASQGVVTIDQKPVSTPDRNRGIVFQKYSLFPHLSVLENVLLGKKLTLTAAEWRAQRDVCTQEAMEFLGKVRLQEHAHKYPYELSGGMQQRVSIVQTLIMKPRIVLMDEPFGALDPSTREDLQVFLLELWEEFQMTVFFVTHDLEEAAYLGTRLIVLSQHYRDERAFEGSGTNRGAKIIGDYPLERAAASTTIKGQASFQDFIAHIRREGFDPASAKHVSEFNLKHKDSFQTLTEAELKKGSRIPAT